MRLWSLHPSILDRAALVAAWREALLAQKVLAGQTRGYTRHPQLTRFRAQAAPMRAIGAYLVGLRAEATARGYTFDATRIQEPGETVRVDPIPVTSGQLGYELEHLRAKCAQRAPAWLEQLPAAGAVPTPHPLFSVITGDVEAWERPGDGPVRPAASRPG